MNSDVLIGSLRLDLPLVNGSGVIDVVSHEDGWNIELKTAKLLGAFTTKTITREARPGHPQPWAEVLAPQTLINSAGLPNPGITAAMRDWATLTQTLGIPIIASIGGEGAHLSDLATQVEQAGWAAAIELNLSCPNTGGDLIAANAKRAGDAAQTIRQACALPLLVKLTAASDIAEVARTVESVGADALTCINTIPVRAVNHLDGSPLLGTRTNAGLSGQNLHPIALQAVETAANAVSIPIVGLGGICTKDDAKRMFEAGASIIGVGTGAVFDPSLIGALRDLLAHEKLNH